MIRWGLLAAVMAFTALPLRAASVESYVRKAKSEWREWSRKLNSWEKKLQTRWRDTRKSVDSVADTVRDNFEAAKRIISENKH